MISDTQKNISRIGLGTAQFGLDYGISNMNGQVAFDQVAKIVQIAQKTGIDTLDTAALYGDSEQRLGNVLECDSPFRIVTKTIKIDSQTIGEIQLNSIKEAFEKSRQKLGTARSYDLLVHDADDLLKPGGEHLVELLRSLQEEGLVRKAGVSVYSADQIDAILNRFEPELVQMPINVLDQRLIQSGHLTKLKESGAEIHMRSTFLQGLLLMPPDSLDPYFGPIIPHLKRYHNYLKEGGVTSLQAALGFALNLEEVDRIIVGVCSCSELEEITQAARDSIPVDFDFSRWSLEDPAFLNPAEWCLTKELA